MDKVISYSFLLNCGFYGNVESSGILVARRPFYQIPATAIHPPAARPVTAAIQSGITSRNGRLFEGSTNGPKTFKR
jgi:hypothetical protein